MPTLRDTIVDVIAGRFTAADFPVAPLADGLNSYDMPPQGFQFPRFEDYVAQTMQMDDWQNQLQYSMNMGQMSGEVPQRPDHYRVRSGLCACGFASYFIADMEAHLRDNLFAGPDGIPRQWMLCERCRASAACREVAVPRPSRPSSWAGHPDAISSMEAPQSERVWRCDSCTRGL